MRESRLLSPSVNGARAHETYLQPGPVDSELELLENKSRTRLPSLHSPVLLGLEGFWNIHIVALLVLLSRVSSDGGVGAYVKPPSGYCTDNRERSPAADKTYSSDDEEMMEQVSMLEIWT